jgi:hypothetical protein
MAYPPILKLMRLVSEEEAVGRNAKELAEDHNHAKKHSGRDGETPLTPTPKKGIFCFCGGNPRSEKPRPEKIVPVNRQFDALCRGEYPLIVSSGICQNRKCGQGSFGAVPAGSEGS